MSHLMECIKIRFIQLTLFMLSFLSLQTAGPSRKAVPCWGVVSVFMSDLVQKHLEEMGKPHALTKTQFGLVAKL